MSVRGFSFNKLCYDHKEYSTNGLQNELVDTIPNIKRAIQDEGMSSKYSDGVFKLYERKKDGGEFIGKVSLTLVGDS